MVRSGEQNWGAPLVLPPYLVAQWLSQSPMDTKEVGVLEKGAEQGSGSCQGKPASCTGLLPSLYSLLCTEPITCPRGGSKVHPGRGRGGEGWQPAAK